MSRYYACIISPYIKQDRAALVSVAHRFSYLIEMLDDGILFDVSGLERLIGKPHKIAEKIVAELREQNMSGSVAVADTIESASLLAREHRGRSSVLRSQDEFPKLPLSSLPIDADTLGVFNDLGFYKVEDLLQLPREELIRRYGDDFRGLLDIIEQNGPALIAPNVKQDRASWNHALDSPVEDFEQLIFLLNHGLEKLFRFVANAALSTEHLDIFFKLRDRSEKAYEIKSSFPTLDRSFWLKLINLRVSLDPPQSEIAAVTVTSHFTKPRPAQLGLYAVSRPQPESLLLTVNKLKRLVGEDNVGVPVILDQRLAEPFILDADAVPQGCEAPDPPQEAPVIAFSYFRPPIKAEVLVRNKRLVFIKTGNFSGRVVEHSGVWREDSRWWEQAWKTEEWDIEVEGHGVYRLCRSGGEWFLVGEYD